MKVFSYNINGIRAVIKKGFVNWLAKESPDVICLQEIKALKTQFDYTIFEKMGYHCYWNPAEKKGYSGVAILSKEKPKKITFGIGDNSFDTEGRFLKAEYNLFSICSIYFPSGSSGFVRQDYKMKFLKKLYNYIKNEKKPLILSGDFNICHKAIDIHDPIRNKNSSGFLPEEREWITGLLKLGFIDIFRALNSDPENYTWWSYRSKAKLRNKGWRIDYHMISTDLLKMVKKTYIMKEVNFSDHCPIVLEIFK